MNLRNVQAIAKKEYLHLIRDFRSLYLAFFIPLLLVLLFGYALSLDVEDVKTVVVDHNRTAASRDFIRKLDASAYFSVIAHLNDADEVIRYLDHNRALLGIVIPPDWTENIKADRKSPLQVIIDGSDPNFAGMTRGYITAFISDANRKQLAEFLNRQGMEKMKPPVEGRIRVWRIKGVHDLSVHEKKVLYQLHSWREGTAEDLDRPTVKVISDGRLVRLARIQPQNRQELYDANLTPYQVKRFGPGILESLQGPWSNVPEFHANHTRPAPDVVERYHTLKTWRKGVAARRGVDSDVILPNAVLWELAENPPSAVSDLEGVLGIGPWRRQAYGPDIVRLLNDAVHL